MPYLYIIIIILSPMVFLWFSVLLEHLHRPKTGNTQQTRTSSFQALAREPEKSGLGSGGCLGVRFQRQLKKRKMQFDRYSDRYFSIQHCKRTDIISDTYSDRYFICQLQKDFSSNRKLLNLMIIKLVKYLAPIWDVHKHPAQDNKPFVFQLLIERRFQWINKNIPFFYDRCRHLA